MVWSLDIFFVNVHVLENIIYINILRNFLLEKKSLYYALYLEVD
jgi:hypothetical protein